MKALYFITGSCPQTEAEVRLEMADIREAEGEHESAQQWREIVDQMRREWADRSAAGKARRAVQRVLGPDPDEYITPTATPEHPMFWHEPRRDDTVVCPCGHFASFLCDEPVGKAKTCDRPSCECCRVAVGEFDQCDFHAKTTPRQAATDPPLRRQDPRQPPRLRVAR